MDEVAIQNLVRSAEDGGHEQRQQLFVALYGELHRTAQRELRRNGATTLSPTTLLHETYLNITQRDSTPCTDRGKFMAYASRAMRGLLIDYLRKRQAQKRGGEFEITSLPTELPVEAKVALSGALQGNIDIEKLGEALNKLASVDARLSECVDLKFFCGFSFIDIAEMRAVTERTVRRDWEKARIWLHRYLDEGSVE